MDIEIRIRRDHTVLSLRMRVLFFGIEFAYPRTKYIQLEKYHENLKDIRDLCGIDDHYGVR